MATRLRSWGTAESGRKAAVCLLFVLGQSADENFPAALLTKRTTTLGSHKGQISLPGGMADTGERTPEETALRELHEELGVSSGDVEVIGALPELNSLASFPVFPVVAQTRLPLSALRKADGEVEELIVAPWQLLSCERARSFRFNLFGEWRQTYLFEVAGRHVWGLTAKIIYSAKIRPKTTFQNKIQKNPI